MAQTSQLSIGHIRELAKRTREWRGWDLLQFKARRAPVPWQFTQVVREVLTGQESVLDMGSGDGRVLASLADRSRRGIGIDVSKERVHFARLALPMKLRMRVHFTRASAHAVPAPDSAFHVVLNRHSPLFPLEVDRVLAPGGLFITQQVGPEDRRAITAGFDKARGPLPAWPEEMKLPRTVKQLSAHGFELLSNEEYDVPFVFGDAASLLFWLQVTPFPHDFDIDRDAETVAQILGRLTTPNGIVTNEHRQLVVMRKGG